MTRRATTRGAERTSLGGTGTIVNIINNTGPTVNGARNMAPLVSFP